MLHVVILTEYVAIIGLHNFLDVWFSELNNFNASMMRHLRRTFHATRLANVLTQSVMEGSQNSINNEKLLYVLLQTVV